MSIYDGPEYSPWGEVQHCETLCAGAFQVSTAGHGGVMVHTKVVNDLLSPAARKCGFQEGRYLCFEEDCDAAVALRELMDKGLFKAPVNDHFKPGEYSQIIDRSLRSWHPKYWAAYVKDQQKPSIKDRLAETTIAKRSVPVANDRYWDIRQGKSVRITSPVGQAQFMLTEYLHMADKRPKEWMLLCRFADTVSIESGQMELRELRRLAEHLKRSAVELMRGDVDPTVAIEVEKEIVLRTAPYYAEGIGHDIAPAAKMLKNYEREAPAFTQAERNLILRYAYFVGDAPGTEQLASRIAAHNISDRDIAAVCASIEAVDLKWSGLDQIEGIEVLTAERPTFQFSFGNCEDPTKSYPRFAFYPGVVPEDTVLLQSGVILQPCPDDMDRWQSNLLNIDQTYAAPRYYIQTGYNLYEMAERVDNAHDLEASLNGESVLPKQSVLRQLRDAAREISQRPPPEGKAKSVEAR